MTWVGGVQPTLGLNTVADTDIYDEWRGGEQMDWYFQPGGPLYEWKCSQGVTAC